jgi:hypothetical protein
LLPAADALRLMPAVTRPEYVQNSTQPCLARSAPDGLALPAPVNASDVKRGSGAGVLAASAADGTADDSSL